MATRGASNIYSGEPLPVPPKVDDVEVDAFNRKLIDYLRRLTGKLARFAGGGGSSVLVFSAYIVSDYIPGLATFDIPWTEILREDSIFSHSADGTSITVAQAGFYIVEVDFTPYKNFNPTVLEIQVNGVTPTWATSHFVVTSQDTYSSMTPLVLSAGDIVTTRIGNGTDMGLYQYGTRIVVSHIGDES